MDTNGSILEILIALGPQGERSNHKSKQVKVSEGDTIPKCSCP
jgi:co-chaperonin GroES (HSP10)